ncbi:MAG: response regulator [Myxococcales bacterium]|nr:response regulator [Myxococcales bacterium]
MTTTILLVDDSRTVRMMVGRTLRAAGHDVVEAADGLEALHQLHAGCGARVVVCDLNMPNMSGLELLETVRAEGRHEAFLMLTTEADPALVDKARALGAGGWLVKPFKPEQLMTAVAHLLARARPSRQALVSPAP